MRDADDQETGDTRAPSEPGRARNVAEPAIMQRQNERSRMVIEGRRTDDDTRCSLVVIHEVNGSWVLYPHGDRKLGVRLAKDNMKTLGDAILEGTW